MQKTIQRIPAKARQTQASVTKANRIRLAAYARVSTNNEDQLESFDNQVRHYQEYARLHPEYELIDIYADEGITGTSTKKRRDFQRMIADCEQKKVDMVITKSISRFARNTQDCLHFARKLKDLNIPIIFERENINTMDGTGELLFTILSSLAQDESRSISENCAWGIRALFRQGKLHLNAERFLGYDKDENGQLIINEDQAVIVRRIYTEFMDGINPDVIARRLRNEGVPGVMGEPRWQTSTIMGVLKNEKYMGDALLQKYYTTDFLSGKCIKNEGQLEQVYIEGNHEPIIEPSYWRAVQQEIARRDAYRERHQLRSLGRFTDNQPFSNRVICGKCGKVYWRRTWYREGKEIKVWMCGARYQEKGVKGCDSHNLMESTLHAAFMAAWNELVSTHDKYIDSWTEAVEKGTELEAFRARQMRELIEARIGLEELDYRLVGKVLDHVTVREDTVLDFHFLDGSRIQVGLE